MVLLSERMPKSHQDGKPLRVRSPCTMTSDVPSASTSPSIVRLPSHIHGRKKFEVPSVMVRAVELAVGAKAVESKRIVSASSLLSARIRASRRVRGVVDADMTACLVAPVAE